METRLRGWQSFRWWGFCWCFWLLANQDTFSCMQWRFATTRTPWHFPTSWAIVGKCKIGQSKYTYDTDNACCIFTNAFSINQSFQFIRDFHSFLEFIIRMNMHFLLLFFYRYLYINTCITIVWNYIFHMLNTYYKVSRKIIECFSDTNYFLFSLQEGLSTVSNNLLSAKCQGVLKQHVRVATLLLLHFDSRVNDCNRTFFSIVFYIFNLL